jgi:two-component system chemotaxis response regulator CheY
VIAQILIADDDVNVTGIVEAHLSSAGHRVLVANDGFTLSRKAAEHRPHLIITDIQMPGAYGSSAYQVLRKDANTKDIPVLFMSGHPYEKLATLLPKDPKTRFLQKPIDFDRLEELIAELLPMGGYCP